MPTKPRTKIIIPAMARGGGRFLLEGGVEVVEEDDSAIEEAWTAGDEAEEADAGSAADSNPENGESEEGAAAGGVKMAGVVAEADASDSTGAGVFSGAELAGIAVTVFARGVCVTVMNEAGA